MQDEAEKRGETSPQSSSSYSEVFAGLGSQYWMQWLLAWDNLFVAYCLHRLNKTPFKGEWK